MSTTPEPEPAAAEVCDLWEDDNIAGWIAFQLESLEEKVADARRESGTGD